MLAATLALLLADTKASDLAALTKGVTEVPRPGLPGEVALIDPNAVAFVLGRSNGIDRAVMAAGRLGNGRVVAIAHDGYLNLDPKTTTLLTNAVRWAGGGGFPDVGVFSDGAQKLVPTLGLRAVRLHNADTGGQVMLLTDHADPAKVVDWVRRGGGVVVFCCPWGWAQLNPGKSLARDLSLNRILEPAGLVFADGYTDDARPTPNVAASDAANAAIALADLAQKPQGAELVVGAVRGVPPGSPFEKSVRATISSKATGAIPTEAHPIAAVQPYDRLAIALDPMPKGVAPSAADFPGLVPEGVPRVMIAETIDATVPQWHTFGAYAAPGETVEIRIPDALLAAGPKLRIGLHTDENWALDKWTRHPSISAETTIVGTTTRFQSPFGGIVALELEKPVSGPQKIELRNVVRSARFVLGKTTPAQWEKERQAPAPWAEIGGQHLILTVPRANAVALEDPTEIAKLWDSVLKVDGDLDGRGIFPRPERIVPDRQISAGYMHSGYPIMTWIDVVDLSLNAERMRKEGSWGHFHELGHNRQEEAWTFDGTGEVTNNLYTLRCMEQISGQGLWSRIGDEKTKARVAAYKAKGSPFKEWKDDPFLALFMYAQLIDAFGWDKLGEVFRSYEKSKPDDLPKSDDEKRDQWMVRYSQAIGRNLGPFFVSWGVPTSESAQKQIASLPAWMPKE
ncbi:hypothetical protein BH11ARM2_BH11ARM2_25580 [soil metagenome]